jgi:hypothetical protein
MCLDFLILTKKHYQRSQVRRKYRRGKIILMMEDSQLELQVQEVKLKEMVPQVAKNQM